MLKTKLNPKSQDDLPAERKTRAQIRPFALRIGTAAPAMDMSPENLRTKIENGEIVAVRSGKLLLITTEEIERYLASLPRAVLVARPGKVKQREQAVARKAATAAARLAKRGPKGEASAGR
jgi:excisionase family DNA binding protein